MANGKIVHHSTISVFCISICCASSSAKIAQKSHQSKRAAKTTAAILVQVFCFILIRF